MTSFEDTAARNLASQGLEKIEAFQSVVDRARRILDEEGLDALRLTPRKVVEPYEWEKTDVHPDADRVALMAAVEDEATGQGLTAYFFVAPCRDDDELRRHLARKIGRHLANAARVTPFSKTLPSARFFLSAKLTKELEGIADGNEGPGALSFLAQYHMNYG